MSQETRKLGRAGKVAIGLIAAGVLIVAAGLGLGGTIRAGNYVDQATAYCTDGLGAITTHSYAGWLDCVHGQQDKMAAAAQGQVTTLVVAGLVAAIVGGVLLYRDRRRVKAVAE